MYKELLRFLNSLSIPFVASFGDAQHYHHAAKVGAGVNELPGFSGFRDRPQWEALASWLEGTPSAPAALPRQSAQVFTKLDVYRRLRANNGANVVCRKQGD